MPNSAAEPGRRHVEEQQHSPAGLAAALESNREQLIRFFTSRTGDPAEAEDVVQEIWIHVSQVQGGPIGNPRAYLHKVGMNIVLDRIRSRQRRGRRERAWSDLTVDQQGIEFADDAPSAFRVADGRQRVALLAAAIDALPPGAGRVFRRHKLDGVSHAEIAVELGITKSAVEKHIAVALRHLRKAMDQ